MADVSQYQDLAGQYADQFGINRNVFNSLIMSESSWNPNAKNPSSGAAGLGQLMPSTAAALGLNPYNVSDNLYGSAKTLSDMLTKYNGNMAKAIAGYKGYSDVTSPAAQAAAAKVINGANAMGSISTGGQTQYGSMGAASTPDIPQGEGKDIFGAAIPYTGITVGDGILVAVLLGLIFFTGRGMFSQSKKVF